ncbi:hypothetical protein JQS43_07170 [Natronosporangium hydrolyticum]|uniref:Uncharacterized protein n=1 Tax=Natronosporangium hydrolyticum TaxID=2811111 RepID=A0A895YKQ1_9ACTN|nr:hypothetical protein [Natronosporangium hydrolyticum]QSB16079.1 hypothetical protein JQS43_07170 [Natronosporangium hydrolyticum]
MTETPVLDTPEAIREHLEIALDPADRRQRGVRFVLCDADNRVMVHCPVDDVPADVDSEDCTHFVSVFASALAEGDEGGGMLVALTRPGSGTINDLDRIWFRVTHEVCAQNGVRVIGVHLLTPSDHREIHPDDAI